ncbi:hypothetical protein AVEN_242808-1, partial [Araneus ventricosus]
VQFYLPNGQIASDVKNSQSEWVEEEVARGGVQLSMERGPRPSSISIASGVVRRDILDCSVVACIDFPKRFLCNFLEILLDGRETQVFPDVGVVDIPGLPGNEPGG